MTKRLALIALVLLAACGSSQSSSTNLKGFKLAVMLSGTPADRGWNDSMYLAANQVAKDRSINVQFSQNTFDPTQSEPVLRQFLTGGFSVIVVDGFNFAPVVTQLAPQYPKQLFSLASFGHANANVGIHTYSYLETGYSMCWLGARLSKSHIIGSVGASAVPFNTEENQGCALGADAAVSGTKVINVFANDFFDQQKAREQTQNVVDQGADVIFVSGGVDSSLGAVAYCKDHSAIICLAVNTDQSDLAPNNMISSAVIDWKPFLNSVIDEVAAGKFTAHIYDATFENGGLVVPQFKAPGSDKVPAGVQQDFLKVIAQLKAGQITLPASGAHPGYR